MQTEKKMKIIKEEKAEKMRRTIEAQLKEDMEMEAKSEEQKRFKRQW